MPPFLSPQARTSPLTAQQPPLEFEPAPPELFDIDPADLFIDPASEPSLLTPTASADVYADPRELLELAERLTVSQETLSRFLSQSATRMGTLTNAIVAASGGIRDDLHRMDAALELRRKRAAAAAQTPYQPAVNDPQKTAIHARVMTWAWRARGSHEIRLAYADQIATFKLSTQLAAKTAFAWLLGLRVEAPYDSPNTAAMTQFMRQATLLVLLLDRGPQPRSAGSGFVPMPPMLPRSSATTTTTTTTPARGRRAAATSRGSSRAPAWSGTRADRILLETTVTTLTTVAYYLGAYDRARDADFVLLLLLMYDHLTLLHSVDIGTQSESATTSSPGRAPLLFSEQIDQLQAVMAFEAMHPGPRFARPMWVHQLEIEHSRVTDTRDLAAVWTLALRSAVALDVLLREAIRWYLVYSGGGGIGGGQQRPDPAAIAASGRYLRAITQSFAVLSAVDTALGIRQQPIPNQPRERLRRALAEAEAVALAEGETRTPKTRPERGLSLALTIWHAWLELWARGYRAPRLQIAINQMVRRRERML